MARYQLALCCVFALGSLLALPAFIYPARRMGPRLLLSPNTNDCGGPSLYSTS
jgi:hypothetical protein